MPRKERREALDVDMSVFVPTMTRPDPQPEDPERIKAKLTMKAMWEAARSRMHTEGTPNRECWCCISCHRGWAPGEAFYLVFNADTLYFTAQCPECWQKLQDDPTRVHPLQLQRVLVKVVGE